MGRRSTGTVYESCGSWFLALTLDKRRHFKLDACCTQQEAELRKQLIVETAIGLKRAGRIEMAVNFCEQAGLADEVTLTKLRRLMHGVLTGVEEAAPRARKAGAVPGPTVGVTIQEFGEQWWTNNELARQHRKRVKPIDHAENARKLRKHVYPVVFNGRTIGETPLDQFTLEHAEHVLRQPTLPEGSVRHVAQVMHRLLKLAVFPAQLLGQTPFPPGWLPEVNDAKAKTFLYPAEDEKLLACAEVPLVRRLFFGFADREGPRKSNIAALQWSDLELDGFADGGGNAAIDRTKNGEDAYWALDPGTAEALRRWRTICPSDVWVFPAAALPRYRRRNADGHMYVAHAARDLRDALITAGVKRAKLFRHDNKRTHLRFHDLRATFVTLALARGMTEDWVRTRTGHCSSEMIARYRRNAETVKELKLGWLEPLYLAIPELRAIGGGETERKGHLRLVGGKDVNKE